MSAEEFSNTYLRAFSKEKDEKFGFETEEEANARISLLKDEDSYDWTDVGAVTDVIDQGHCGSCWSISVTGALEGLNFIKNKKLLPLSKQQLIDCDNEPLPFYSPFFPNHGCYGGNMPMAFQYTAKRGLMKDDDYQYTAKVGKCQFDATKVVYKNKSYKNVTKFSNNALVTAIRQQPVSIGLNADKVHLYKGGVFNDWSCGWEMNHGVLAVGYGTEDGKKFYKMKNSWGNTWGENGYFKLARGDGYGVGMCGILTRASYPTA